MAAIDDMTLPLTPESFFHIFNRGNGGIQIFYQKKNYTYFLSKYAEYMKDYWDTFAYCLLPDHFHLLVSVKSKKEIIQAASRDFQNIDKKLFKKLFPHLDIETFSENPKTIGLLNFENLANLSAEKLSELFPSLQQETLHEELALWAVRERFRRFLLGYAKSINRQENRNGSLFQKLFKRKLVQSEEGCKAVAIYIHRNGVHHKYCTQLEQYPWSSFLSILSNKRTLLKRKILIEWFGGIENFIEQHHKSVEDWKLLQQFIIEE